MVYAIVLAAGIGKRFGGEGKKQFLSLLGRPVVVHSLSLFQHTPLIDKMICVVPKEDQSYTETLMEKYDLSKVEKVMPGGRTRQDSVNGAVFYLEQLMFSKKMSSDDLVLVHDGVRPLITHDLVTRLLQKAKSCGAAVAARRVTDSIKTVSDNGFIQKSLERNTLWGMQTPQVFRLSILAAACRKGMEDAFFATDEAMLVERLGVPVFCVEGPAENIKITNPEDLLMADFLMESMSAKRNLS